MSKAEALYRQYVALIPEVRKLEADRTGDASLAEYDTKMIDLRCRIEALPPEFNSVAALLLLQSVLKRAHAHADELETATLHHMRPRLTGLIREHVDLLLNSMVTDCRAKLAAMPFCG